MCKPARGRFIVLFKLCRGDRFDMSMECDGTFELNKIGVSCKIFVGESFVVRDRGEHRRCGGSGCRYQATRGRETFSG